MADARAGRPQSRSTKATAARLLALEATRQIEDRDAYASSVVASLIDPADLSREERAFASLLTYGVASCKGTLDEVIDRNLNSPKDIKAKVRAALRVSTYELVYLAKEPYVALDQGVELVRSTAPKAAGLANAVLHKIARDIDGFPWGDANCDLAALARLHGYPLWMVERVAADRGFEAAAGFCEASDEPAPLYIAVNPFLTDDITLLASAKAEGVELVPYGVSGCFVAYDSRKAANSAFLKDARGIVCDASAQLVAYLATPRGTGSFLEVGSGRGTKSILLQGNALRALGTPAKLFALDIHEFKREILEKRLAAASVPGVCPVCCDATQLDSTAALPSIFDGIFIDAPCSGLGTLRRHAEKRWRVSPEDMTDLAELGYRMLAGSASHLAPGGFLVYATCTVERQENEDVIARFLASEAGEGFDICDISRELPSAFQTCATAEGFFQSMPSLRGADGHFAAKLMRRDA